MNFKQWMDDHMDQLTADLAALVSYNSVEDKPLPGKPFGEGPAAVLAEALRIAERMGFRTVNLDNYCGYAEIGEGKDLIGIAGHLDIVPVGDGWDTDPFTVTRIGDRFYGRGTTDDKGPVLMALYAVKYLQETGASFGKRVRIIFGCNEETGSRCMEHYNQVEEPLTMGFTPDASYPCIYGEKAHMTMTARSKHTRILSMKGGFVSNAVCHQCTTVIPADSIDPEALRAALADTPLVSAEVVEEGNTITIRALGEAAHASTPLLGINAAAYTMEALAKAGFTDDFVDFYNSHLGTACDGSGVGLKISDAYGELTFCNGIVKTENGVISCTIDIRVPVTFSSAKVRQLAAPYLEDEKGAITIEEIGEPLFFPEDSDLVQALFASYTQVTGDTQHKPMVIGGGTYAKSLSNIIAFGPEMPGIDYRIHNANEFIRLEDLQRSTEIYACAIGNLLKL